MDGLRIKQIVFSIKRIGIKMEPSNKKLIEYFVNEGNFKEALLIIVDQMERIDNDITDLRKELKSHKNDIDSAHKI